MDDTRKALWLRTFHAFSQVWSWLEPTPDRISVWDAALSDLSVKDLALAASKVLANHSGSQPPTPGEMRDAILGAVSWETVTRELDGKVMGRRQTRELAPSSVLPAPEALHVALDPDANVPLLPSSFTRSLERRFTP